jgi:ATPase subunit of ABC transporter with duplicated ATPase domains
LEITWPDDRRVLVLVLVLVLVQEYRGGVVLVSHDARLIEATDCQILIVGENRDVVKYREDFRAYRAELLDKMEEAMAAEEARKEARREEVEAARVARVAARTSRK